MHGGCRVPSLVAGNFQLVPGGNHIHGTARHSYRAERGGWPPRTAAAMAAFLKPRQRCRPDLPKSDVPPSAPSRKLAHCRAVTRRTGIMPVLHTTPSEARPRRRALRSAHPRTRELEQVCSQGNFRRGRRHSPTAEFPLPMPRANHPIAKTTSHTSTTPSPIVTHLQSCRVHPSPDLGLPPGMADTRPPLIHTHTHPHPRAPCPCPCERENECIIM
ncbi:hypothetical protein BT67DRAFT_185971 [Trichocladium antarcticum]|uniref:Uncharacterized protein n=1 Tax=Trichocladium antarcticum TaxID=1450529 RepID=A0AAN6UP50_9PEZI|nr:hypothetical protein BT67DRAFT_185971 [Trichocladium antarcticum]